MKRPRREMETPEGNGEETVSKNFSNNEFWKCIGCIISSVTFEMKWHKIWQDNPSRDSSNGTCLIYRDVRRKPDLLKVSFTLYCVH